MQALPQPHPQWQAGRHNDGAPQNLQGRGSPDPSLLQPPPIDIISKPIRIATLNILTLNEPSHPQLLSSEFTRLNISIAGLQEVRWTQDGETKDHVEWHTHCTHGVAIANGM